MENISNAISITNLNVGYEKSSYILNSINLKIIPKEKVGIIGANGTGKTTFFLTLCGILSPDSGTIYVFNKPIIPGKFNSDIGLVFQNPEDQLFCLTVEEDIRFGLENLSLNCQEINKRIDEALSLAGVNHLRQNLSHHLSGGEKYMIAIATVLAMQPKLILYDEPSAHLDLRSRRRLINFLQRSDQTILLSSHDLELVFEVCDRVLLFHQGQIRADGHPRKILSNQSLMINCGLETPYSLSQ